MDNILTCQLKGARTCANKFIKAGGIFTVGKWICSEPCMNEDSDIKQFNDMEEKNSKLQAEQDAEESEEVEIDL